MPRWRKVERRPWTIAAVRVMAALGITWRYRENIKGSPVHGNLRHARACTSFAMVAIEPGVNAVLPLILAVFAACFVLERWTPGWTLPRVRGWPVRVVAINLVQLGVVLLAGVSWERWARGHALFELPVQVGPAAGGVIAYFIATFVFYWWHRWRHESPLLWRLFHQIHHSPQRIEVITSFYKHPGEMVVNSLIGCALVYVLLGLSPEAGAVYTLCTALGEFFYHTNVRTPRWVGYVFQRPEMHRVHHEYGRHRNNYGDIPWWDMLFGTWENPSGFSGRCGYDDEREQALWPMLAYRDVHARRPAE